MAKLMFTPQVYTLKDKQLFESIGNSISDINKYFLVPVSRPRKPFFIRTVGLSGDWLYTKHGIFPIYDQGKKLIGYVTFKYPTSDGTPSFESWFIKHHVISPFGGWDAEKWHYF